LAFIAVAIHANADVRDQVYAVGFGTPNLYLVNADGSVTTPVYRLHHAGFPQPWPSEQVTDWSSTFFSNTSKRTGIYLEPGDSSYGSHPDWHYGRRPLPASAGIFRGRCFVCD